MEQQNERNRQARRPAKRRRVRYDRIFIALALLVVLLILLFSCTCSCVKCVCSPSEGSETSENESATEASAGTGEESGSEPLSVSPSQTAVSLSPTADDMHKGTLAVVNANNQYTFPAGDVNLVSVDEKRNSSYTADNSDIMLDETVVLHLNEFLSEFSTVIGKNDIKVTGGYRSKEDQNYRYSNGASVFAGGCSDYHTGRSFDLSVTPEDGMQNYYVPSGDYSWINDNAYKYGFVLRYPEGKIDSTGVNPRSYTFHYVGKPHSYYMNANDLCLEEYVEAVKSYPATSPLTVDTGDTVWTVFYTELSAAGGTVINIPSCQEYTVSGDNISGFIVAYH